MLPSSARLPHYIANSSSCRTNSRQVGCNANACRTGRFAQEILSGEVQIAIAADHYLGQIAGVPEIAETGHEYKEKPRTRKPTMDEFRSDHGHGAA